MNTITIFIAGLIVAAALEIFVAVFLLRLNADNIKHFEKVARFRHSGAVIAFLCLLWCIPNARPIVWNWMEPILFPLTIMLSIIAWWLLDYLFARAVGGLAIISAYWLLHEAFTFHAPWLPLFAIFCWTMGIVGLFFSARPHLLRDLFRKVAASRAWQNVIVAYLASFAVLSLLSAFLLLNYKS